MPSFLGSKSNSKRRSHTPATNTSRSTTPQQSTLLSRLPLNASSPAVYYGNNVPRVNRGTEYLSTSAGSSSGGPPPPYDLMVSRSGSPVPTPSTSWTSEMSMLADKIRDDATAISPTAFSASAVENLDRKSISQGMKLVAIAADEYEDGNETVALDIYLSGIDKILMALPSMFQKLGMLFLKGVGRMLKISGHHCRQDGSKNQICIARETDEVNST